MKEYIISFFILFTLGILFFGGINHYKSFSEIDFCLDRGYCWDYIRQRCETDHQGFCVRNSQDCIDIFNGVWDEEKKYCKIND